MEQRQKNRHETSESWLRAATNDLRSYYADRGLTLPEKIRFSIAFTSHGKPPRDATAETARWPAECWPAAATDDGFCEIIIRADFADPLEILGILAHELVHVPCPMRSTARNSGTRRCASASKARCGGRCPARCCGSV